VVKERGEKLLNAGEFLCKSEITPLDIKRVSAFANSSDRHLSGDGLVLKNRVSLSLAFYKSVFNKSSKVLANNSGYVPGVDSFLDNFIKHYQSNAKFRDSLVVNLMKGYVAKVGASRTQSMAPKF